MILYIGEGVLLLNNLMRLLLAETMAKNLKEEIKMENIEIKEEIQENILPSSTVEDTCTVYVKEEAIKMENIEIKEEIQENILPSSTVEDSCTVYIKKEVIKMENTGVQGKFSLICVRPI